VFVMLAVTGDSPTATSVGNVIRLPPPAIALTAPAASAAPATAARDDGSALIP
jgi:hypothetical protein